MAQNLWIWIAKIGLQNLESYGSGMWCRRALVSNCQSYQLGTGLNGHGLALLLLVAQAPYKTHDLSTT